MRRWIAGAAVLVLAVAALTLALLGTLSHTSRRDTSLDAAGPVVAGGSGTRTAQRTQTDATTSEDAPTTPSTPTAPLLTPSGRHAAPTRAQRALTRALDKQLRAAGPQTGVLVYDLGRRSELFAVRPATPRPPASVEKLWTTTALLDHLGAGARFHTALLGTGTQRGGVWHGNLYLRGGGDPTFGDAEFNHVWNQGDGSTAAELVAQLRRMGIRRVTGKLYADESLFDRRRGGMMTNLLPDVPDFGGQLSALTYDHGTTAPHYDPATFAAHELALTMRGSHIGVAASTHDRTTPRRANLLASVSSPPLSVMTRLMDVPSDDLFAEMFTKQLGVLFGRGGTIASGARVIASTVAAHYGLHPRIVDGSGLSRQDRTSPLQIVALLRDLWHTPTGRQLAASLPTVGVSGTVQGIAAKTAAQGRCLAKTGTLDGVTNLAGYCTSRGGHPLAFGMFIDGPDNATAFTLEGRMLAAIARY